MYIYIHTYKLLIFNFFVYSYLYLQLLSNSMCIYNYMSHQMSSKQREDLNSRATTLRDTLLEVDKNSKSRDPREYMYISCCALIFSFVRTSRGLLLSCQFVWAYVNSLCWGLICENDLSASARSSIDYTIVVGKVVSTTTERLMIRPRPSLFEASNEITSVLTKGLTALGSLFFPESFLVI